MVKILFHNKGKFIIAFMIIALCIFLVNQFVDISLTGYWVESGGIYNCSNCSDCSDAIANASSGNLIQLTADINNQDGNCIEFFYQDNVIFDCQGHYIGGDFDTDGYGIFLNSTGLAGSDNNKIRNCNITGFNYGIYSEYSNNITLTNITTNNNSNHGIYFFESNSSTLTNITANNNSQNGILLDGCINNTLTNATTQENGEADLYVEISLDSHCEHSIQNITGSGGIPIEFYNYNVTVEDKELSELILCNADSSTVDNVTIRGSDTKKNNFLFAFNAENLIIKNVNSSGNYDGIRVFYGNNNTLTNITASDNNGYGINLFYSSHNILNNITVNNNSYRGIDIRSSSDNVTVTDITANDNTNFGISLYQAENCILTDVIANRNSQSGIRFYTSNNNTLTNITLNSNYQYGIEFMDNSDYNVLNNSYIENSTVYGLYMRKNGANSPEYNSVYNNYFNNTVNYYNNSVLFNYFNTTNTSGTNIMGGPYVGGNYWAYPNGTGFSENCTDSNVDGICDLNYSLDGSNYDYLPLSSTDFIVPIVTIHSPTNTNYSTLTVDLNVSANEVISAWWYSNDSGATNNSFTPNITLTLEEGSSTIYVWANDTSDNIGTNNVTFFVDITAPTITFTCIPSSVTVGGTVTCSCTGTDTGSGVNESATSYTENPSTSSAGSFTETCSMTDLLGNSASETTSYTVTSPSNGGGTALPPEEIYSWAKITPGVVAIMKDFDEEFGIRQIQIEVHTEAQDVKITITKYDDKPANVSIEKSGNVYQYLQIETQNLEDKLDRGIITIQVNKSWIFGNNLDKENITMFKFINNGWAELTTRYKEEDSNYYYYDVELDSFSYFVISGEVVEAVGEEEVVSEEAEKEKGLILLWVLIVVLILGIVLVIVVIGLTVKKRNKQKNSFK